MISAAGAYNIAERFLNSFNKDAVITTQNLIDTAIFDAAKYGDMSVIVPFKGLNIKQRHDIMAELINNKYSCSIPEPGKLRISWKNYLLR